MDLKEILKCSKLKKLALLGKKIWIQNFFYLSKRNSLSELMLHDISLKDINHEELKQINACPKLTLINISRDKIEELKSRIADVTDK